MSSLNLGIHKLKKNVIVAHFVIVSNTFLQGLCEHYNNMQPTKIQVIKQSLQRI
jgi:hypothetical protein